MFSEMFIFILAALYYYLLLLLFVLNNILVLTVVLVKFLLLVFCIRIEQKVVPILSTVTVCILKFLL